MSHLPVCGGGMRCGAHGASPSSASLQVTQTDFGPLVPTSAYLRPLVPTRARPRRGAVCGDGLQPERETAVAHGRLHHCFLIMVSSVVVRHHGGSQAGCSDAHRSDAAVVCEVRSGWVQQRGCEGEGGEGAEGVGR